MNCVQLIGNLGKDPELKYTTSSDPKAFCRMTLAVEDGYGDNKRTNWIPVVVWGKIAENCEKYLSKGSKVGVVGRIQTGSYEKNGQKVYTTDVVASSVEFLNTRQNNDTSRDEYPQPSLADQYDQPGSLRDDDIPF